VFNFLFGSWFMDFDQPQNVMSATLAANGKALVVMPHGRPGLPLHRAALGAPIGEQLRTIVDGEMFASYESSWDFEQDPDALFPNRHVAIQGDPTLHFRFVKPVTNVTAQTETDGTRLIQWQHSGDAQSTGFQGYYVYRANSPDGPFTRITANHVSGTSYPDNFTTTGQHFYMVRAVNVETTSSGTYDNASTGVIVGTTAAASTAQDFAFATTHEIAIDFDRNVQSALEVDDLLLTNITTDTDIPADNIVFHDYNTTTNTAKFRFTDYREHGAGIHPAQGQLQAGHFG
jgi:hypothetical protein